MCPAGTVVAGAGALILVGAVAGWRRIPHRTTIGLLAAALVVAEAINLGAIMITAYSAPALLRQVRSLNELVGTETHLPRIRPTGPPRQREPGSRHSPARPVPPDPDIPAGNAERGAGQGRGPVQVLLAAA